MPSLARPAMALLCLALGGSAARKRKSRVERSRGQVHGLYTFGSPGTSTVALRNGRRSDGCFPGLRSWNSGSSGRVDAVPMLVNVLGFHHANYDAVAEGQSSASRFACGDGGLSMKPFGIPNQALHELDVSLERVARSHSSGFMHDMAFVGVNNSYVWNYNQMYEKLSGTGWELRSLAFHNGGVYGVGGAQVSHLLRQSSTGDCMLTFQGSKTDGDWQANFQVGKRSFCGLDGSVHHGFRDHLRRIVGSNDFQSYTKPELARCNRVYVGGHSLGGAMSELFSACANRASAPSSRQDPDGDFNLMSF